MDSLSTLIIGSGEVGLFFYGLLNRLLIVTGLHHILNNLAWFLVGDFHGSTGDLNRFFAGDPQAGAFMAGFFPRSEEHTSELQSLMRISYAVFCLKKKNNKNYITVNKHHKQK